MRDFVLQANVRIVVISRLETIVTKSSSKFKLACFMCLSLHVNPESREVLIAHVHPLEDRLSGFLGVMDNG